MPNDLETIIESMLFVSGEAISVRKLSEITSKSAAEVEQAVEKLTASLLGRGVRIIKKEGTVALVSAPEASGYIEKFIKADILGEFSKAALETITIITYRHPISRAEIDYIRGVNSSFTLRNLLVRGLVERAQSKKDGRMYVYKPTIEFMKHLGITSFKELPEYTEVTGKLEKGLEEEHHGES
jgi:segregation and condensation protein B